MRLHSISQWLFFLIRQNYFKILIKEQICKNYQDTLKERIMNNEGELVLPDVTSYSKASVIKITRYDTGIDIDKSSVIYSVLNP